MVLMGIITDVAFLVSGFSFLVTGCLAATSNE
jgi:hypothetical protein